MTAPPQVEKLVERFHRNRHLYTRPGYKETRARVEYIDPFFEALGWDVRNVQGRGEHDKDVVHEDVVRIGGKTRAPDYSFRLGRKRRFFLEAKKPAVALKGDIAPAYQLRRYAWSAKLPLSILTDFEELAVYDCRFRPKPDDRADVARIMYLTYDQYLHRFDDISAVFARQSVADGSFDRYVADDGRENLETNALRVLCGGSFVYKVASNVRCAVRLGSDPFDRYDDVGFRVVEAPGPSDL